MSAADEWFALFDTFSKRRDLAAVRARISPAVIDLQDEWGMAAVHFTVMMNWPEALDVVLAATPDLAARYHRTGETALHMAVQEKRTSMIAALLAAGANPDAGNYWGITARSAAKHNGMDASFAAYPAGAIELPPPRIQNAEHLADHFHPKFKIPKREERDDLQVGQAVDVHVYGDKSPKVKVRITKRSSVHGEIVYAAKVETPLADTNLAAGTETVTFGPEHVATVYVKR